MGVDLGGAAGIWRGFCWRGAIPPLLRRRLQSSTQRRFLHRRPFRHFRRGTRFRLPRRRRYAQTTAPFLPAVGQSRTVTY